MFALCKFLVAETGQREKINALNLKLQTAINHANLCYISGDLKEAHSAVGLTRGVRTLLVVEFVGSPLWMRSKVGVIQ